MLKKAGETGLMLCSVCFFWPQLPNTGHHSTFNSGATFTIRSTPITNILELLPKSGDDTLSDSKFLGYFQLGKTALDLNPTSAIRSRSKPGFSSLLSELFKLQGRVHYTPLITGRATKVCPGLSDSLASYSCGTHNRSP
ncbi:hypothetical protein TNCV_81371 [Trichonephila clavipes]|nr:hypothetical protein TNCV_81371 [Trichonephila clavipes]